MANANPATGVCLSYNLLLLPHQIFSQETTRHPVHLLPTPDGGAEEEEEDEEEDDDDDDDDDEENDYIVVDDMLLFAAREEDEGLPKDLVERFLKIMVCDEAAAADQDVCAVCLDELHQQDRTVGVLHCHHFFHADCIGEWLLSKNVCPLCRGIALDIF